MKLAVSLATLLLSSGASAFGSVVPTQFVGHWAGSPDACDSDADDLVLRVGADVPPILSSASVWSPIPYPEEIGREE
ncbi:hypothetical protein VDG64_21420, partial [Xanthomonas campestris pv. raphani]|uniref:hypothetical protein n=1 Tax=Xanthomonas campestris TaxID=339 RepID=UPI002B238C51